MGVLLPLYLAGLAALSLPLIFHLVRRTPRGRQVFSSLMFLAPTIPRLTRRSRIDQLLLLLLRLLALALIAFAFSRPFVREASLLSMADLSGRRLALLVDTSASMRRGDLWQQAVKQVERQLDDLNPRDDVALYTFDRRVHTEIDFAKADAALIADKPQVIRSRLRQIQPGWDAGDLGTALAAVAGELDSASDLKQSVLEPQIIVISDFQAGNRIESLHSFEWPKSVPVITSPVTLKKTTNAFARILPNEEGDELTDARVRVTNAVDSKSDQFFIAWASAERPANRKSEAAVYVPAGQSRVVRLPRGKDDLTADRILLRGDEQEFDNTFYVVPPLKRAVTALYAGVDKPDSPDGLQYFFRLAVANDALRQVEVRQVEDGQPLFTPSDPPPGLVVVSRAVPEIWQKALTSYIELGGTLFVIPQSRNAAELANSFVDDVQWKADSQVSEAEGKYLLLGEIDFSHPLFASFAGPRYGDFTKIHFWKHWTVTVTVTVGEGAKTHCLARFDNGDPALLERLVGKGRVLVLTSGWQPQDSQLALSSKFVPLVGSLLDLASGDAGTAANVVVHQPVILPAGARTTPLKVRLPGGPQATLAAGESQFIQTDQPGIYVAQSQPVETRFAVNLAASESNTAPMNLEQLGQIGVRMGTDSTRVERVERLRQQRDTELENHQKIWRWLIVLAIGTLILESFLAGRFERQIRMAATS